MRKHAMLLGAVLLGLLSALSYAQAPVPFINLPLMPDATAPGGPQFTLTVNGTGFVSTSTVNWNGSALATQFVSSSQLTAIVPATDIATASTGWVTVVNPAPGGGRSNVTFFTVTAGTGNSVGFDLTSSLADSAFSVAVGDFNGDGKLDLAVANAGNTVSIFLGDGKGNFTLASSPVVGSSPYSVAVGDFNGDGKLDLAVANYGSGTVSILLGDGAGNFTLASSPVVGGGPNFVAVGDFNGDGKLDLAVDNLEYANTLSILLGDGTGNFTLAFTPLTGNTYLNGAVVVGDFNGDGKLDLAVANGGNSYPPPSSVSIMTGDGTGNFNPTSFLITGDGASGVAVGDFNGDGKLDLAVTSCGDLYCQAGDTVFIFLGDGTGNFTLASSTAVGLYPGAVAVGDFNGDGKLDLAVANQGSGTVSILLGDGAGNFTLASSLVASYPWSVGVGDFNGDGKLDLAVSGNSYAVSILLQAPGAVTLSPSSLSFGTQLIGTRSNSQPVTLTNSGSETLVISNIAASAHFSQSNNCPSSVPPNGQCVINVSFRPPFRGTFAGAVTITDNAANSPQTVPLTGMGSAVSLLPSSLDFGDQKVGTTSQPQPVTFTNHGIAAVDNLYIRFTGPNAGSFVQTNNCGTSVPAGGSCTISVSFAPKHKGQRTATLDVRDNGGGSPQTVALSGTGTE